MYNARGQRQEKKWHQYEMGEVKREIFQHTKSIRGLWRRMCSVEERLQDLERGEMPRTQTESELNTPVDESGRVRSPKATDEALAGSADVTDEGSVGLRRREWRSTTG